MGDTLERAIAALKTLPPEDQERIAWEIIERVEDKTEWDRLIARPEARDWMARQAGKALKEYRRIRGKLSLTFVSLGTSDVQREDSYWRRFDELPGEVRRLAESNYHLWQENPQHPSLRFKQIHPDLPIFSFRVGMRHRTVGVRTDDDRIAWFWIGSFETFKQEISD
ncbi:MAG: hypothetical protein H6907_03150 [Hyphomicrobiales bacterium]|nr:hypothetical protein [Hyphomicrobiales bacterium]MCP5370704.1 hypothetical protein [Hyphomicrobiales bacterium]